MKQLRVGVVGCGLAGRVHIDTIRTVKFAKLTSVCDSNKELAQKIVGKVKQGINIYDDANLMLEKEELDCISICTPPSSHCSIGKEALSRAVTFL